MINAIKPSQIKLTVENLVWLNKKVLKVDFNVDEPINYSMLPGNHLNLRISEQVGRPYSIYFNWEDSQKISIAVSVSHVGLGSNFLKSLKIGDKVNAIAPLGRFILREPALDNIVFVGTGTGASPLLTMLHYLAKNNSQSNIKLYFGVNNEEEIFFINELEKLKSSLPNFQYFFCLSNPINKEQVNNESTLIGRVTQQDYSISNTNNTQIYICGHSKMIEEMKDKFLSLNVLPENIFTS